MTKAVQLEGEFNSSYNAGLLNTFWHLYGENHLVWLPLWLGNRASEEGTFQPKSIQKWPLPFHYLGKLTISSLITAQIPTGTVAKVVKEWWVSVAPSPTKYLWFETLWTMLMNDSYRVVMDLPTGYRASEENNFPLWSEQSNQFPPLSLVKRPNPERCIVGRLWNHGFNQKIHPTLGLPETQPQTSLHTWNERSFNKQTSRCWLSHLVAKQSALRHNEQPFKNRTRWIETVPVLSLLAWPH